MSLYVDCMKNVIVILFLTFRLCIGLGVDMVTAVATGLRACVPVVLLHFRCIKVMETV